MLVRDPGGGLAPGWVGAPVAPGGIARRLRAPSGAESGCWSIDLNRRAARDPGGPISAAAVVAEWRRRLAETGSTAAWLLGPVADGLSIRDGAIEVCPRAPLPDLGARLAHPALWFWRTDARGRLVGPGPFTETGRRRYERWTERVRARRVAAIEMVDAAGQDASLLLRLGEADVAVVYGTDVALLAADAAGSIELERAPAWDRVFFLWTSGSRRWVNDPTFRRWLSGAAEREAAVRFLFDGRGVAVRSLSRPAGTPGLPAGGAPAPFERSARPRLALAWDGSDRDAGRLAERLAGTLDASGVRLNPRMSAAASAGRPDPDSELTLLEHRPVSSDPLIGLLETVRRLGQAAAPEIARLERGLALVDDGERRRVAWEVERGLLADGRLAPLVRIEAWLAHADRVDGIEARPAGLLRLDRARWVE